MNKATNPIKRNRTQLSPESPNKGQTKQSRMSPTPNSSDSALLQELQKLNANILSIGDKLDSFIGKWQAEKAEIDQRQNQLEERLDRLERQEKRNNIVVVGMKSSDTPKTAVNELIAKQMGVNVAAVDAFQIKLRSGQTRIIAKLNSWTDKMEIMKAKSKLPKDIYINDDLIPKDRVLRAKAVEFAKTFPKDGPKAQIRVGKVIVDGKTYTWEAATDSFVEPQKN